MLGRVMHTFSHRVLVAWIIHVEWTMYRNDWCRKLIHFCCVWHLNSMAAAYIKVFITTVIVFSLYCKNQSQYIDSQKIVTLQLF